MPIFFLGFSAISAFLALVTSGEGAPEKSVVYPLWCLSGLALIGSFALAIIR